MIQSQHKDLCQSWITKKRYARADKNPASIAGAGQSRWPSVICSKHRASWLAIAPGELADHRPLLTSVDRTKMVTANVVNSAIGFASNFLVDSSKCVYSILHSHPVSQQKQSRRSCIRHRERFSLRFLAEQLISRADQVTRPAATYRQPGSAPLSLTPDASRTVAVRLHAITMSVDMAEDGQVTTTTMVSCGKESVYLSSAKLLSPIIYSTIVIHFFGKKGGESEMLLVTQGSKGLL